MDPGTVAFFLPSVIASSESKAKAHPADTALAVEAGSYNIMYANAFIQGPASILPPSKFEKRDKEYQRAKTYYLRGITLLNSALEKKYPGISDVDITDLQKKYLPAITKDDVPLIYWLTAGTLCAYSIDPFDLSLGTKISFLSVLIKKAYELDPDYNTSALDEFFFLYYASLPKELGGDVSKAPEFYERALKKLNGSSVGIYVSWAESISIPNQDYSDFKEKVDAALAVDIKKYPDNKLTNILARRKAEYYAKHADLFFVTTDTSADIKE
jgi:predicted anti-sigma-YlaC factor YlaD